MSYREDCICDECDWDEYCSEECDGPYEIWKARIEAQKEEIRRINAEFKKNGARIY
jgi:hypothetical protein